MSILIAGIPGGTHVGHAFFQAAQEIELSPHFFNCELAYEAPYWLRQLNWRLRGKYPSKLRDFSEEIVQTCLCTSPKWLLTTGIAPVSHRALQQIGAMGIQRINFSTDDPWNAAHYAPWFFQALPHYDIVFSPRRATVDDLLKLGCSRVEYLPFGYDPELFYPEPDPTQKNGNIPDVIFAGGADRNRVPYMHALIQAGMSVDLYGGYWERYSETRFNSRGKANIQTLRSVLRQAKIALCLVRRANRDGHCMRTFEVPAVGGCMLTEDTQEHREIFGAEGEAVIYFSTIPEMIEKARWLLVHDAERQRLSHNAHQLITQGANTYRDRLKTMIF
ncbi:CgeB family protein [Egbenema bharatensis]|uniref:CgeB family protein n=1 Tax=Egbenema bharatensis TaxID=3463334 RepID=UPI003A8ACEF9